MAKITGSTSEKVFSLKQWGGLNENPDGDTKLKLGEASVMTNWKVTRDGNLKRRPGSEFVCGCRNIYAVNTQHGEIEDITTASGSIVSLNNPVGVAVTDLTIAIEPVQAGSGDPSPDNVRPITGWTGANVYHCGKNFCDPSKWEQGTVGNDPSRGGFVLVPSTTSFRNTGIKLPAGTYTFSSASLTHVSVMCIYKTTGEVSSSKTVWTRTAFPITKTIAEDELVAVVVRKSDVADEDTANIKLQIERNSSASAYEAYTGTTIPITFPDSAGTVYGGTLDVTTGVLTVTHLTETFQTANLTFQTSGAVNTTFRFSVQHERIVPYPYDTAALIALGYLSDAFPVSGVGGLAGATPLTIRPENNDRNRNNYVTFPPDITTAAEAAAIVPSFQYRYPLITPQTYQLTPQEIQLLTGENNIWVDTGNTTIVYGTYASEKASDAESLAVYKGISLGQVPGTLQLVGSESQGTATVVTADNYENYRGWYFKEKGKFWQLFSSETIDGTASWTGYRVTAAPSAGGTFGIVGMWSGWLDNEEIMLVACVNSISGTTKYGFIYEIDTSGSVVTRTPLHENAIPMPGSVFMFGFGEKIYFLTGAEYYEWDGVTFKAVEGYVPLVAITLAPNGTSELLESINLLNGKRRVWLSPDGEGTTFKLPEKNETDSTISVDYVKDLATDTNLTPSTDYSFDPASGNLIFNSVPAEGTNSYEVAYSVTKTYRSQVASMRFAELYSGTQDTRVFVYGDGTNQCLYSGLDYWGKPCADYFPDLNACAIGDSNTPITAMIRHYSTLVCYKRGSAWSLTYGVISLTSDTMSPAFYATPVNRRLGNEPYGQVVLVNNSPVTLTTGEVYQWSNSSYYSSNLTQDERQARRISDRIQKSIKEFDLEDCFCFDDNFHQEYYICHDGDALVWNYASDAWYKYEDFDMVAACNFHGETYYGTSDGRVFHLTDEVPTCDDEPIVAYWESGAMDFGQDYMRKYAAMLWLGIKPDDVLNSADESHVTVTVRTDRKEEYSEKVVTTTKARVGGEPFMTRLKIKAKKFTFYTLILENDGEGETPTVNCADIRVRFMGMAK